MSAGLTLIGPAGWSYSDWKGIVYPSKPRRGFDPLSYLADFFDSIEINSTFYRPPSASSARSWVARVSNNPRFRFTAKLYNVFTHNRGKSTPEDEKAFREGIQPLAENGRLGAILIQFPWSFRHGPEERRYLAGLLDRFSDFPLVVEVRHQSWNRPSVYQSLERRRVGFCNIDQPLFSQSIAPSALATSRIGYVRLHGRNYGNWFREDASSADRYDYLYSPDELAPWVDNIRRVSETAAETYVIANNHFEGKGAVNALQIKSMLEGSKVRGPETLLEAYPELESFVDPVR